MNRTIVLDPKEYGKVVKAINELYESRFKGRKIGHIVLFSIDDKAYSFTFEIIDFNNYRFIGKSEII